ncbi:hypothetical protein D3C75_686950 [compost metagenome]
MSEIDIRNDGVKIDKIVFSDCGFNFVTATHLKHASSGDHFKIGDENYRDSVIIESETQARNLIKALEKAIELRWVS